LLKCLLKQHKESKNFEHVNDIIATHLH